ncbi:PTS system mannitol (Cryptic)-specific transporter subunit IIA [Staphylococcus aureus]|uniref:PTS system mannitol (Cryptic)-specific transporter subunit IIA n=1 Tax=Staphylococcus aureus TaxID=1280 RepID=A0A2X2KHN8_STAAU|nr:PTS system mannitol (Cryptic)-specific transporter subunit IIA [Staphylococcus aureus]
MVWELAVYYQLGLEQVFSEIERITQASVSDLKSLDLSQYDGIISTVNLDIDSPI